MNAIVDINQLANIDDLGNVLVIDVPELTSGFASRPTTRPPGSAATDGIDLHVLGVASSGVLLIGGDVENGTDL